MAYHQSMKEDSRKRQSELYHRLNRIGADLRSIALAAHPNTALDGDALEHEYLEVYDEYIALLKTNGPILEDLDAAPSLTERMPILPQQSISL
jgi:hypothetical protein